MTSAVLSIPRSSVQSVKLERMPPKGAAVNKLLLVAEDFYRFKKLSSELIDRGFNCTITADREPTTAKVAGYSPDLVLVAINGCNDSAGIKFMAGRKRGEPAPPVIALLPLLNVDSFDSSLPFDDFILEPWVIDEVVLRMQRVLSRANGVKRCHPIECGDMVIDPETCEITISGRQINLTFREYELIKFLASNRGTVFTRDALLDEVWGHDYYGGDRTVDVHVRRLRSKMEDATHTFIETVRNVGYRFVKTP